MHRHLAAFFLALGLAATTLLSAQPHAPWLWRVETNPPSFLYGTVHLGHPDLARLHPAAERAFLRADVLLPELTLEELNREPPVQMLLLPLGQSARNFLSADTWNRLDSVLRSLRSPYRASDLAPFKLWVITMLVQELAFEAAVPAWVENDILDVHLIMRAAALGKPVIGLETQTEQLNAFDGLSLSTQAVLLEDLLKEAANPAGLAAELNQFTSTYLTGDETLMLAALAEDGASPASLEFDQRILHARDGVLATRMDRRLRDWPHLSHFFAVGVAHLIGEQSLPVRLRQMGYRVTRIRADHLTLLAADLGGGWRYLDRWEWVWTSEAHDWVFHPRIGWVYPLGTEASSWVYHPVHGWVWTGSSWFPWAYRLTSGDWVELGQAG